MIERKCKGCGAILQDQNKEEKGFIPNLTLESKYCKRCFRMMHYNELPKIVASNKEYEHVIDDVIKKNGLISKVSSFFVSGVIYMTCLYVVAMLGLYILNVGNFVSTKFISGIWNVLIPVLIAFVTAILMITISVLTVKTRYSSKKIKAWKDLER